MMHSNKDSLMPLLPMRPKKAKTAPTPAAAAAGSQRLSRAYDSMVAISYKELPHDSSAVGPSTPLNSSEPSAHGEESPPEDDASPCVASEYEPYGSYAVYVP